MSFQEVLWFIPLASFVLAWVLMRRAGSLAGASDSSVKKVRLAEERARQLLAGGRKALEYGPAAVDVAQTSAVMEERRAPRKRKESALACGVIDRGSLRQTFLRVASPSAAGRYVAAVRGGLIRPRRLVFLNPAPVLARAAGRRIPSVQERTRDHPPGPPPVDCRPSTPSS